MGSVQRALVLLWVCVAIGHCDGATGNSRGAKRTPPTFYKDVAPILQQHCQACHRADEIAPMPLVNYDETRRYAREIKAKVTRRIMPPWFADPCCGHFANDPSLTPQQIATLVAWTDAGAPGETPRTRRRRAVGRQDGSSRSRMIVVTMPKPVEIPANGDVEYTYEIVPTGFTEGRMGANVGDSAVEPRECASRRSLRAAAGFEMAAARAGGRAVHGVET